MLLPEYRALLGREKYEQWDNCFITRTWLPHRVTCKTRSESFGQGMFPFLFLTQDQHFPELLDAFISAFGRIYLSQYDFNPSQITILNFRHLVFQSCIKVNHIPPNWSFYMLHIWGVLSTTLSFVFRLLNASSEGCGLLIPTRTLLLFVKSSRLWKISNVMRTQEIMTSNSRQEEEIRLNTGPRNLHGILLQHMLCPRAYICEFDNDEGYVSLFFVHYLLTVSSRTCLTILFLGRFP